MSYPACLISQKKVKYRIKQWMPHFSYYNHYGYKKFLNTSLLENFWFSMAKSRQKKKLALRALRFSFIQRNYTVKVKTKFWSIAFRTWKSPQCYKKCIKESVANKFFIWNHSLQNLRHKILVANNAQGCSPILSSLWQLSMNKVFNAE
jgi:hypothetical protein